MGKAVELLDLGQRTKVASQCFQIDEKISTKEELRGNCPFHHDDNPSFSYNPLKDLFNCLGCGETGDLIALWSHVKGYDRVKGFSEFCKEYDPTAKDYKVKKQISSSYLEEIWGKFPPLPEEFICRMIKERCWTREGIKKLDLRLQTFRWDKKLGDAVPVPQKYQNKIAIAIRGANNKIKNIRFYQPGAKEFKLTSFAPGLGKSRLWPSPEKWKDEPVWIIEGEPDVICAISHGINATTQTAGAGSWKKTFSKFFRDRDVIIAYDADGKGIRGGEKIGIEMAPVAESLKVFRWPDFMGKINGSWPEEKGQDLTDWFARHKRTKEELFDLLPEAKEIESTKNRLESVERFFPGGAFKSAILANEIMKEWEIVTEPDSKMSFKWNGKHWEIIDLGHVRKKALNMLGFEGSNSRSHDAASQVKDLSLLPQGETMNLYPDVMCLENGMLDLKTLELRPHSKEYYSSYMLNTTFNPDATCKRWRQFLEETIQDEQTIDVLQEFAGYILTPDVSYEKALFLYGRGSDGKSTFIKILEALVGEKACSAIELPDLEKDAYRAVLHHKLLNTCSEVEGSAFGSGWFKRIISGDSIEAAYKYRDVFKFKPKVKMVFAFNRWPKVLDNTDAFYRRLITVKFKKQFSGKEKDTGLYGKLLNELPGILNWALEGLDRLRRQKTFTDSRDINRTLITYRFENNPVMGFVSDLCRTDVEYEGEEEFMNVRQDVLYPKYKTFCSKCGFRPLNLNSFSRELRILKPDIGIRKVGTRDARYKIYTGIIYVGGDDEK